VFEKKKKFTVKDKSSCTWAIMNEGGGKPRRKNPASGELLWGGKKVETKKKDEKS